MSDQTPDPRPGNYYVSVVDADRFNVLAGPFPTHQQALDLVETVRRIAEECDPRACWYGFGTTRMKDDYTKPGLLNDRVGIKAEPISGALCPD